MVALPCGSRSTSRILRRVSASAAARLTAVVVLPTPPFWLVMAMMRVMGKPVRSSLAYNDQMAFADRGRHLQRDDPIDAESGRHGGDFRLVDLALQRQRAAAVGEYPAAPRNDGG